MKMKSWHNLNKRNQQVGHAKRGNIHQIKEKVNVLEDRPMQRPHFTLIVEVSTREAVTWI